MARIPKDELDRLKRDAPLRSLVEAYGVALKAHGRNLVGQCPFHDDRTPSLVVTPARNLWHCLGACKTGGSAIDWVMKTRGVSFRHAVEVLRAATPGSGSGSPAVDHPKLPLPVELDASDQKVLRRVVDYYHETLKASPEALRYLESRGLRSSEMLERFRLGFANRTLTYRLPAKTTKAGTEVREKLQKLGVYRKSGHEHFNGSLVIPVFDEQRRVTEIYGRKVGKRLRKGTPNHLYLPGPHRGVWNVEVLAATDEVILCESLIDALTFWCAGYRNVTASYGTGGFTADHLDAFKRYGVKRVLVAYDRDAAGDQAAEDLAGKLAAEGIDCYRIVFPRGMDANEYALKVQPAQKALGLAIRKARWLGKGKAPPVELGASPAAAVGAEEEAAKERSSAEEAETTESDDEVTEASAEIVAEAEAPVAVDDVASAPPLASPEPPPPPPAPPVEVKAEEVVIPIGDRRYRVRGLQKNLAFEVLKVNVLVSRKGLFHVDTFDLYQARPRAHFVKHAAAELGLQEDVLKKDLGRVLLQLEKLQEEHIRQTLEPAEETVTLTEEEQKQAMELLLDPELLERILADFERCGVVGESTNKLLGYLAATSRKLEEPLAVVIQSSSAAGKSSLMEAILAFMPDEDRVKYSAMTGQSLFYMGETKLKHKILAIVEEEGAEQASYALKLLQSEGELRIASTGKDGTTGKLTTHEYRVHGPVMIFLTTTAIEIDEELLNRCIVLTIDEDREQTRAIHRLQRRRQTLDGLLARRDRDQVLRVHQNAQRLLRPLLVTNPFAERLTFVDDRTRTRRDHMKYLTLIRSVALLHQHQRPIRTVTHEGKRVHYIEVTVEDIEVANRLAHEVLGRSLDELPPQTRRLLLLVDELVTKACDRIGIDRTEYRFTRREVREHTGWGNTQLKLHLRRLEELEYLLVHRGGRGQRFVYELLWDCRGNAGAPFLPGLIDTRKLYDEKKSGSGKKKSGVNGEKSAPGRPQVAPKSPPGRVEESLGDPLCNGVSCPETLISFETAYRGPFTGPGTTPRRTSSFPLAASSYPFVADLSAN